MARCACPLSDTFCVSPAESLMRWTGHHLNLSVQDCFRQRYPGDSFYGQLDRQLAASAARLFFSLRSTPSCDLGFVLRHG